jgi:sugar-phosphatase
VDVTAVTLQARAVLLDMDGTLVDSTAVVERVWTEWALAHSLDPVEVIAVIHGRQAHESMASLLPDRPPEENFVESRAMAELETAAVEGITPIAGAQSVLEALSGAPHALVTSATIELAGARMAAAGLAVPEVAVTAEHVRASKPDPDGFLVAAAALGVPPQDCVVFEDSGAGIDAAHAAGMRVVGVGTAAATHGAEWTVADLADVRVTVSEATVLITLLRPI